MTANPLMSLLWFLGIGALFYFMMRAGGCGGGHHHHGGGADRHRHGEDGARHTDTGRSDVPASVATGERSVDRPVDPVCGMPVKSTSPALQRTYAGRTFFFCSEDCLRKFDAAPARWSREASAEHRHHTHGC